MGVRAKLADFLNHLPAVDSPDERKALLAFTGPADLGIYLDWQGSNVAFTERLLEELGRRGKEALSTFLNGLPQTPQVTNSVERKQWLAALRARIDALDEAAFRAEFPTAQAAGGTPPTRPADPAMLAAAVVNEVLAPYYTLGAGRLRQQAGGQAVTLAEGVAGTVAAALARDVAASAVLSIFQKNPELGQAGLLGVLKARLQSDPVLAGDLAGRFAVAAAAPGRGGLPSLANVSQQIGVVKGDVVGAVVGSDVLRSIQAKIDVHQEIDTVEAGGTVVGAVVGGPAPVNVGGVHPRGDAIDTGGGAYIPGTVQGGVSFSGRDQVIDGDHIEVGDVHDSTGVAIGRGTQATVTQGIGGGELAELFGKVYQAIENRAPDPDVEKEELAATVENIEQEAAKGQEANPKKVERWFRFLADMAPDILEVAAATLANPIAGVAVAIRHVAERARSGT